MAEVWERQPGESSRAYAAFCIYRDLGPWHKPTKSHQIADIGHGGWSDTAGWNGRRRMTTISSESNGKSRKKRYWIWLNVMQDWR